MKNRIKENKMNEIIIEVVPSGLTVLLLLLIYGRVTLISKLLKK